MKKNIKDYLHLYLGCDVKNTGGKTGKMVSVDASGIIMVYPNDDPRGHFLSMQGVMRLILRPLSSMTEAEFTELALIIFHHKDTDYKISEDELDIEMFYNDGGNMVDLDVAVGANISCRCYEGQIAVREDGSIHLFDEDDKPENVYNIPEAIRYLLSKHFDIFGLIGTALAINIELRKHGSI